MIKTGDMIQITIPPPAVVPQLVSPVPLKGSSADVLVANQPACLKGDELPLSLQAPLTYTAPPYVTPGTGTLKIVLLPTNLSSQTINGKPLLLKGSTFQAMFQVQSPAMMPTPAGPQPDPLMAKTGTAKFITTNSTVKAG